MKIIFGMGGVPPHDNPQAYVWERRLHWVMIGVALLVLPAFYLEVVAESKVFYYLGVSLDALILLAFSMEFIWMLYLTRQRGLYVLRNWLDLLIIAGAALSFLGVGSDWVPLARLLRVAYVALVMARAVSSMGNMISPSGIPYLLGWGLLTLALAGAGFYWLEPTVHSYSDGLWLAFVTGATVGYGDFVPTTTVSRIFAVLMVIVGFAVLSLVTASIAAFLIGEDEKKLRREMHQDIKALREDVANLREDIASLKEKRSK